MEIIIEFRLFKNERRIPDPALTVTVFGLTFLKTDYNPANNEF
jgi:hypothetical protein